MRDACMQTLERIRVHAGLTDAEPFGRDAVEKASGYMGHYSVERSAQEETALRLLRDLYERTTLGPLETLLAEVGLSVNMTHLRSEYIA
jgi:hypothetical protein